MSRPARRSLGLALAVLTGLAYVGCATSSTDTITSRPNSSDAGSPDIGAGGDAGAPSGSGAVSGKGGMATINTDPSAAGAAGASDSCAAQVSKADTVPLDMLIMMDTSLSMNDVTDNGIVKWAAVKGALETFMEDDSSKGLGVGIQYFPQNKPSVPAACTSDAQCGAASPCLLKICMGFNDGNVYPCITNANCDAGLFGPTPDCEPYAKCADQPLVCTGVGLTCTTGGTNPKTYGTCNLVTDPTDLNKSGLGYCVNTAKCDAASYSVPDQAITTLPGGAAALVASIESRTPAGNTPTAPALTGAISQASTWAKAHPNHQVITVFVTDGLPTQCGPRDIASISKIAGNGLSATPSIETFVIGIFGATDIGAGAASNLDKIALAGGTKSAFILYTSDDVSTQLITALNAIRSNRLACDYLVPEPQAGEALDYSKLNVDVKTSKSTATLLYVGSVEDCDPITGGWYYDTDPATTNPTRIVVCPTTCAAFQTETVASVDIAVGCQTIVK